VLPGGTPPRAAKKAGQRHGEPEARVGHAIKGWQNVCDQASVLAPYMGSMDRATFKVTAWIDKHGNVEIRQTSPRSADRTNSYRGEARRDGPHRRWDVTSLFYSFIL
jgi:hypothetical protein